MAAKKGTKKEAAKQTPKALEKAQGQGGKTSNLNVRIDRLINRENSNVKAIASLTIDGFAVHGFKIMDSQNGLFVAMPSNSFTDGKGETQYSDIFHPITKESREDLIGKMKTAYEKALEESQNEGQDQTEEEEEGLEEEPPQLEQTM